MVDKVEIRLHPSLTSNQEGQGHTGTIEIEPSQLPISIERESKELFRVFVDILWKETCGGGKSLLYYDLTEAAQD